MFKNLSTGRFIDQILETMTTQGTELTSLQTQPYSESEVTSPELCCNYFFAFKNIVATYLCLPKQNSSVLPDFKLYVSGNIDVYSFGSCHFCVM